VKLAMLGLWLSRFFCSVKALGGDVVLLRHLEGFATEISVRFLAYNIAVLIKLKPRRLMF